MIQSPKLSAIKHCILNNNNITTPNSYSIKYRKWYGQSGHSGNYSGHRICECWIDTTLKGCIKCRYLTSNQPSSLETSLWLTANFISVPFRLQPYLFISQRQLGSLFEQILSWKTVIIVFTKKMFLYTCVLHSYL